MTTFSGTRGVTTFQAIVLRSALMLYRKTKIRLNRTATPTAMLRTATQITGKSFKRGQYDEAIAALTEWIDREGAASGSL